MRPRFSLLPSFKILEGSDQVWLLSSERPIIKVFGDTNIYAFAIVKLINGTKASSTVRQSPLLVP